MKSNELCLRRIVQGGMTFSLPLFDEGLYCRWVEFSGRALDRRNQSGDRAHGQHTGLHVVLRVVLCRTPHLTKSRRPQTPLSANKEETPKAKVSPWQGTWRSYGLYSELHRGRVPLRGSCCVGRGVAVIDSRQSGSPLRPDPDKRAAEL